MIVNRVCLQCNQGFLTDETEVKRGWGNFCSKSCVVSFYNHLKPKKKRLAGNEKGMIVSCEACGKDIFRENKQLEKFQKFFCDRNCQITYRRGIGKFLKEAENYKESQLYPTIRTKRGNKCQICGWLEATCDFHHILPLKEGGETIENNLILLCPNHHRLADRQIISEEELRKKLVIS